MVIVGIINHAAKLYCRQELNEWLETADLEGCEVVMLTHEGPYGEHGAVKAHREMLREIALNKGASHLFLLGADVIPPPDVVKRAMSHNVAVAGGVYYGRQDPKHPSPVAWPKVPIDGKLHKVDGMGMDCVLFSREAFSAVSWTEWEITDDDYPYYDRLRERGFDIWLDTAIICKHYYATNAYV